MAEGYVPSSRTPCGKCCRQRVRVSPTFGDDPSSYETRSPEAEATLTAAEVEQGARVMTAEEWGRGDLVLKVKGDGHCTYLADDLTHCTIYARRPHMCRIWECDPRECLALQGNANG